MIKILLILSLFSGLLLADKVEEQKDWEDLSPVPNGYDWIQLTSGEWLKGDFIAMYKEVIEFDSKELDLQTFDLEDVRQIKTYYIQTINVEDLAILNGKLFMYEDNVILIMGENQVDFNRSQIISIAHGGDSEKDYWSGKVAIGIDISRGNTNKLDINANVELQRRTSRTRLDFQYRGVLGSQIPLGEEEVVINSDNQRSTLDLDYFQTKYFYLRPLISEYYIDPFQNINHRSTLGVGLGYRIFDTLNFEFDTTLGVTYKNTVYQSVVEGADKSASSPSMNVDFKSEYKINSDVKYKFDYTLSVVNKESGSYTHHMVHTFETEFIEDFEIDMSVMWDYVLDPVLRDDQSLPDRNDFRYVVSIGYNF